MRNLFYLLLALSIMACETTDLTHSKRIENKTNYDVKITFGEGWQAFYETQTITIPAGSSKNIYNYYKTKNTPLGCSLFVPVAKIEALNNGSKITKDINLDENWMNENYGNRSVTERCTFIIAAEDLR